MQFSHKRMKSRPVVHVGSVQKLKPYEPRAILNALAFGKLDGFLAKQWLVVVEKAA